MMKKIFLATYVFAVVSGCTADPALPAKTLPEVNATSTVTLITATSSRSGGIMNSVGGAAILDRGVCLSLAQNPTVDNFKFSNPGGPGSFTCDLNGLLPGVTYYVRAYATNSVGTAYGNNVSFTTLALPTITTNPVTSITTTTSISGGNISNGGGSAVTARGVCWSTTTNPTITLSTKTLNGTGTGGFSSSITGLATHTSYYVRAYATNSTGTAYGQNILFTTN